MLRAFLPAVGRPQEQGLAACATVSRGVATIHRRWHGILLLACQRVKGSSERDSRVRGSTGRGSGAERGWLGGGASCASDCEVWGQLRDSEATSTQRLLPHLRLHCSHSLALETLTEGQVFS